MRRIAYTLHIGYCGCDEEGIEYIPDGMTNNDIDTMVNDMAHQYAQSWEGDSRLGFDPDASEEEQEDYTASFYEGVEGSWDWIDDGNPE